MGPRAGKSRGDRLLEEDMSKTTPANQQVPYLIIGSGIAGLMLALKLVRSGRVMLIAKDKLHEGNSFYAQGGIASVLDHSDSFSAHVNDTIGAGGGLCHQTVVRQVVEAGPQIIEELISLGANFTRDEDSDELHLTREGGHSARRVIHARDITGRELIRTLIAAVRSHPNIDLFENQMAIDLITTDKVAPDFRRNVCLGAYVLAENGRKVNAIRAGKTFLCTGGHGKTYLYTSNPDTATGDGLAMAWRAGCRVANLEFMQFHPTCLYHPNAKTFLVSEALRGEGAELKDFYGDSFMERYHPLGSLAPRDVVARAIDAELKQSGEPHVYLDATGMDPDKLLNHFPNINNICLKLGIDFTKDMIPVVPAAHYSCGGIVVDQQGQTGVEGLFAVGEVACTGLHGANRLASNSLLEAAVFASIIGDFAGNSAAPEVPEPDIPAWEEKDHPDSDELVMLAHSWDEIRRIMWHYVGIVRSIPRLQRALTRLIVLRQEIDAFYWDNHVSKSVIEVRNLAEVAYLTVKCAIARKESRGIHYNLDYPETKEAWCRDTVLR